ncbi:hypothetical protein ACP70R_033232 [Stipagrostis hirtigluma subsp. patula]
MDAHGLEQKHGPNWKVGHPQIDATVIYENVGRTPHGRLAICDEAINLIEKEVIKTRKRNAQPHVSARELRLERKVERLQRETIVAVHLSVSCGNGCQRDGL